LFASRKRRALFFRFAAVTRFAIASTSVRNLKFSPK